MTGVAVVGQGRMARAHASAWRSCGAEVSHFVVRHDRGMLPEAPDALRSTSFRPVLEDEDVAIVSICTPGATHERWAVEALACGKSVLLEKPIATTEASARRILRAAERSTGTLAVAHVLRFDDGYRHVAEAVRSGRLGAVRTLHAERSVSLQGPEWWADAGRSGGLLVDVAVHDCDQVASIMQAPTTVRSHREGAGLIRTRIFDGAIVATVDTAVHDDPGTALRSRLRVEGVRGTVEYARHITTAGDARIVREELIDAAPVVWHPRNDSFRDQARYVLDCHERRAEPDECNGEAALRALLLALSASRALATGEPIEEPLAAAPHLRTP